MGGKGIDSGAGLLGLESWPCVILGKLINHSILVSSSRKAGNSFCIMRMELFNVNYLDQCLNTVSTRETLTIISSSAKKITYSWPIFLKIFVRIETWRVYTNSENTE